MKRILALLLALTLLLTGCAAPAPAGTETSGEPSVTEAPESAQPPEPLTPAQRIQLSEPELLRTDEEMPFIMDSVIATLRQPDGSVRGFHTYSTMFFMLDGTPEDPFAKVKGAFYWDFNGTHTTKRSTVWLMNLYQCEDGTLIGFCHREDLYDNNPERTNNFWIGLAISEDNGENWKYLGDICGNPCNGKWGRNEGEPNMGGVPLIVRDGYFYIYFNEYANESLRYITAARMKVDETVACAKAGTLPEVKKYGGKGKWDVEPLAGLGTMIVPNSQSSFRDSHADAAYCAPLDMYMLTVQTHAVGDLELYLSEDCEHWSKACVIDHYKGGDRMQPYSFFVGLDEQASDDFNTVGSHFYIFSFRKGLGTGSQYDYDEMYRTEVQILDEYGNPIS